ncbi:PIG-L family deacetylase [Nocardioides cynanchi]|uniref:PIG-L family deacetylase n=1 Tax=Nocardioides cynanchi TaxID=2558918 RepID=UPI0012469D8F|nr:PIG-L family deacetylase [Nocardioides cynanchi]
MVTTPARPFTASGPGTPATVWSMHLAEAHHQPADLTGVRRVVVVGAHPDDESLGAGGLVATARALDLPVDLVCATDGEGSHPASPTHTPDDLARRRTEEWLAAADALGVDGAHTHRLGLPDGGLDTRVAELTTRLVELVGDGRDAVVVAPWSEDGHPDHEAVGRAAAATARRTGAQLWEFPIWLWHWSTPSDPRARRLRPLALDAPAAERKQRAIAAHASQVSALSSLEGDETLLTPSLLAHFAGGHEWFVITPAEDCADDALDRLHRDDPDPWGVDSRWYERRKRALLLAALPRERFRHVLEIGCSTGALTAALAERADRVLGVDRSVAALAAARQRLADLPGVAVADLDVPHAWPDEEPFDLVVVSEVGYFLSPQALDALVDRVSTGLSHDGVVVLCHWRHPVEGWVADADDVHRRFHEGALPPLQADYRDRDVEIRVHAEHWPDPTG